MAAGGTGALICGVALGATGGYLGRGIISSGGESAGELIYQTIGK
ncbi:hypothetical protein SRDD_02260 [Serratia sp. DD3]|nr:hypothetical protein SRDD_02260 [Serratia sp. DD3]